MIERAVRRESRNATDLRIVLLEDEHFVTVHSRKVKPLVPGRMLDKVNFSRARRVAHFAGHKIGRAQCAAITDSKRRIKDGSADRTPDIDDAVTIDRCGSTRVRQHPMEQCAAGRFGIVVVNSTGGSRPAAITMPAECERGSPGFTLAHEMIEQISALSAGGSTCKLGHLFVVHTDDFFLVEKIFYARGCVPEFKAFPMH